MIRRLFIAACALILAACGGGGSNDAPFRAPSISTPTAGLLPRVGYVVVNMEGTNRPPESITIGLSSLVYDASDVVVCAREIGSSASCGDPGTTGRQLLPSRGPITLDIWRLQSVASWYEWKPTGFEIIFYRPYSFWVGDQFTFSISSAVFDDYDRTIIVPYNFPVMLIRGPLTHLLLHDGEGAHKRTPSQGAFLYFMNRRFLDNSREVLYFFCIQISEYLLLFSSIMKTLYWIMGSIIFLSLTACSSQSSQPDVTPAIPTQTQTQTQTPITAIQSGAKMSFFITSVNPGGGGNLGGLAGADAYCQSLANSVGAGDRTWRAYLSTTASGDVAGVNARDRIGKGPWYNAKGMLVADNLETLHGVNALSKMNSLDEKGNTVLGRGDDLNNHDILTGSIPDGAASGSTMDTTCGNWTTGSGGSAIVGHHDRIGINESEPMKSWNSSHGTRGCSLEQLRTTGGAGLFYCFAE